MQNSPATIIFDLDGTLVDTAPDLVGALNACLAEEGLEPVVLDEARNMIGAGARALLARGLSLRGAKISDARFDELHRGFLTHYAAHIADHGTAFPGMEQALDRLAASGYRLAVCTNKTERLAKLLLDTMGLTGRFAVIVGGDTLDVQKPNPRPLQATIERAGGNGAPVVFVGDSGTDLWTARNAGVPLVGVSFGYTDVPMAELGPDILIDHFDDLPGAVAILLEKAET